MISQGLSSRGIFPVKQILSAIEATLLLTFPYIAYTYLSLNVNAVSNLRAEFKFFIFIHGLISYPAAGIAVRYSH